jgi:hypothetical protein
MITNISILREYIITNKCTLPQRAIPAAVVGDLKLLFFIDRTSIMLYRSLLHKIYIYAHPSQVIGRTKSHSTCYSGNNFFLFDAPPAKLELGVRVHCLAASVVAQK